MIQNSYIPIGHSFYVAKNLSIAKTTTTNKLSITPFTASAATSLVC